MPPPAESGRPHGAPSTSLRRPPPGPPPPERAPPARCAATPEALVAAEIDRGAPVAEHEAACRDAREEPEVRPLPKVRLEVEEAAHGEKARRRRADARLELEGRDRALVDPVVDEGGTGHGTRPGRHVGAGRRRNRSEERRVGKECRSR